MSSGTDLLNACGCGITPSGFCSSATSSALKFSVLALLNAPNSAAVDGKVASR